MSEVKLLVKYKGCSHFQHSIGRLYSQFVRKYIFKSLMYPFLDAFTNAEEVRCESGLIKTCIQ